MGTLYACRERRAGRRLHGAFLGTELRGSQQSESPAYQSLCVVCLPWGSFGIYVLHNPLLVLLAWAMDKLLHFPVWSMYLLLPVLLALLLPPLIALIKRIPVLRTLVLGEK